MGADSICPEVLIHASPRLKFWLLGLLSSCLRQLKISEIWRRALVAAIPKPAKPVEDPQSYRPISLLCVRYRVLERLNYNRAEPIVDPFLPKKQTTVDQVVLLTVETSAGQAHDSDDHGTFSEQKVHPDHW